MGKKEVSADLNYDTTDEAAEDVKKFSGSVIRGWTITFTLAADDPQHVVVTGLPPDLQDGELEQVLLGDGVEQEAPRAPLSPVRRRAPTPREPAKAPQPLARGPVMVGPVMVGTIIFNSAYDAKRAKKQFNGTSFEGSELKISVDENWQDWDDENSEKAALKVLGLAIGTQNKPLKEHFENEGYEVVRVTARKMDTGWLGEVKFSQALFARKAVEQYDDSWYFNNKITVFEDRFQPEKVKIKGLPDGVSWMDLKDHFADVGTVISANLREIGPNAPGKGGGKAGEKKRKAEEVKLTGVLKFEDDKHLAKAATKLSGSRIGKAQITVEQHATKSKLLVYGLSSKVTWQQLFDHFSSIGAVSFADIKGPDGASVLAWGEGDDVWAEEGATTKKAKAWDGASW